MDKMLPVMIVAFSGGCGGAVTSVHCEAQCTATDDRAVDRAEPTSLGMSWDDLVADTGAEDRQDTTMTWYDYKVDGPGAQTGLAVEVTPIGSAALVDYECDWAHCADGMTYPDPYTETRIESAAMLSFATADGAFQETWPVTLFAVTPGSVEAEHVDVDGADVQGDLRDQLGLALDEEFHVGVWLFWDSATGFSGSLSVRAERYERPEEEGDWLNPMADW